MVRVYYEDIKETKVEKKIMNLLNLKTWVHNYCLYSSEDEALFREYMGRLCYKNGQVLVCTKQEASSLSSTTYILGVLHVDEKHNLYYYNGDMVGEGTNVMTYDGSNGLWLID